MEKLQQCGISSMRRETVNWVQCSVCSGWYHCICVGMALELLELDFCCCKTSTDNTTYVTYIDQFCTLSVCVGRVLRVPLARKHKKGRQVILMKSDVQSLYAGRGLSDGILDFFLWYDFIVSLNLCILSVFIHDIVHCCQ